MSKWRARGLWVLIALLSVGVGVASASITTEFEGRNGYTAVELFDKADLKLALSEWDRDELWLGSGGSWHGYPIHGVAGDADGVIYFLAHGYDYDSQGNPSNTGCTGVIRFDVDADDPFETLYQKSDADFAIQSLVLADLDSGAENTVLKDGDLVLLDRDGLYVLGPTDAAPVEIYDGGWSAGGWDDIEVHADGSIYARINASIYRVSYDPLTESYSDVSTIWDDASNHFKAWDVGPNGDVYAYLIEHNANGNPTKNIIRMDADGLNSYTDFYAKASGSWSDITAMTFHTDGKLYMGDYKKKKTPPRFLSKRNNKGKFPYGKRIAQWTKASAQGEDAVVKSIQSASDGSFIAVLRTLGGDHRIEDHAVWRIEN